MNIKILLIVFLSCCIQMVYAQIQTVSVIEPYRSSKIKSVTQFEYDYLWGYIQSEGIKKSFEEYDRNGNIIRQQYYDESRGKVLQEIRNRYNNEGMLIHSVLEISLRNLTIYIRDEVFYKYNPAGNVTEEIYYTNGVYTGKYLCEYDDYGNQVMKLFYSPGEGNIISERRDYRYDKNGNRVQEKLYNYAGNLISTSRFFYDSRGNKIKEVVYDAYDNTLLMKEWRYNAMNELSEFLVNDFDNARKERTVRSFSPGRETIVETYYDSDEDLIGKNIWEFNELGIIKEHVYYNFVNVPEKLLTYHYEFFE